MSSLPVPFCSDITNAPNDVYAGLVAFAALSADTAGITFAELVTVVPPNVRVALSEKYTYAISPELNPVAFNLNESPAQSHTVQFVTNPPSASAVTVHGK